MLNSKKRFQNFQFVSFLALIVGSLVLTFYIFKPFLSILFFAATLGVVFHPLHLKILKFLGGKEVLAALISVFLVIVLVILPVVFIGALLFQEASDLYVSVTQDDILIERFDNLVFQFETFIQSKWPSLSLGFSDLLVFKDYYQQGLSWVIGNIGSVFSGFLRTVFALFLIILTLFYFFKDGVKFKDRVVSLGPLSHEYTEKVLERIKTAINSVVRGRIFLGLIQGVFAGIGFAIFSIPNPILWGTIAAVLSILPAAGPLLVIVPAALYAYFVLGSTFSTLGLLVWGLLSASIIDNYIGTIMIERGLKIHPFLILLSVLGGLALFGPIGFVLGPVSLGLLFALLDIYPFIVGKEE